MTKNLGPIFVFALCCAGIVSLVAIGVARFTGLPDALAGKALTRTSSGLAIVSVKGNSFGEERRTNIDTLRPIASGAQIYFVLVFAIALVAFTALGVMLDWHRSRQYEYVRVY